MISSLVVVGSSRRPAGCAPRTEGYSGDGPSSPGGNGMLGDGARALRLERDRTPRALPDVFRLREGPPVSQVDPAMPSESNQAKTGLQGSVQAKNGNPSRP